jgi:hypothetical protein
LREEAKNIRLREEAKNIRLRALLGEDGRPMSACAKRLRTRSHG